MNDQKPPFHISHDYEILPPEKEKAYPIPMSDWEYLKKKLRAIQSTVPLFHTVGTVLLSVAGSALLAAISLPRVESQIGSSTISICWVIFIATLISGLLSMYFASQQRKVVSASKDDVLDEMERMEHRYSFSEYSLVQRVDGKNILFSDDFSSLDNWIYEGDWTTHDNILSVTKSERGGIIKEGLNWRNYQIEFKAKIRNHDFSFIVRALDLSNYVMVQCQPKRIRPHYRKGGSWQALEELAKDTDINPEVFHDIKIIVLDNSLTLYVDNKEVFKNDSLLQNYKKGSFGFRESFEESAQFKDLLIKEL